MKKILLVLIALFGVLPLFAKSYADCLAEAKKYEEQERWCFALGSYYDALQTKEAPENKREACEGYAKLRDAIKSGKPGFSSYDDFTINDEWEKLIIDAEKYFSSICRFDFVDIKRFSINKDSVQLDFQTRSKTATYGVWIDYDTRIGRRYETIMSIIRQGLKTMIDFYTNEYSNFKAFDGANDWPEYSVSYKKNNAYNENGALTYAEDGRYYNAFYYRKERHCLYKFLINIVDDSGKELVEGKKWIYKTRERTEKNEYNIVFSGVSQAVADLIDNRKARVNIAACYLSYGKSNEASDKDWRSFVNSLPEVQISMDKCAVGKEYVDYSIDSFVYGVLLDKDKFSDEFVTINGYDYKFKMHKTEVTQGLYRAIMSESPSNNDGECTPVDSVSWYDAVYFCNKLSQKLGYKPVYSVNGETNVAKWGYTPHKGESVKYEVVQDLKANGFRLPTKKEWKFAAKGGQDFKYSGSNNLDEVGWYEDNCEDYAHPVAQKKPNGYGLYDMSGNVMEWVWDASYDDRRWICDGCYQTPAYLCELSFLDNYDENDDRYDEDWDGWHASGDDVGLGFRIARTVVAGNATFYSSFK